MRKWVVIAAMLSVLLHASAFVRHHHMMLHAQMENQALAAGLALICHGNADAAPRSPTNLPEHPKLPDAQHDCPVCSGHAPAFPVVAPDELKAPVRFAVMASWLEPERLNPALRHTVCPPPRGPPASVLPA